MNTKNRTGLVTSPQETPVEDTTQNIPTEEKPRANRAARRSFTAEYKRKIVEEYHRTPAGEKGAVLRRERLYDSNIQEWRNHINAGTLQSTRRGPAPGTSSSSAEQVELTKLRKQVTELEKKVSDRDLELANTRDALQILGKAVAFLEALSSKNAQ